MANPSLQIGNSNWAIKKDNLLGYSSSGTRFFPIPITMTRASAGTRVNPQGLVETVELFGSELVTNGDFESGTSGWIGYYSGTLNNTGNALNVVDNGGGARASTSITTVIGKTYKYVADITQIQSINTLIAVSNAITLDGAYVNGANISTPTNNVSVTFTATATTTYIGFKRNGAGVGQTNIYDNVSVKEYQANDLARVDYTGSTSSLLAEPQRTNVIEYSEDFSNSYWAKSNANVESNAAVSPDGTQNADKLNFTTSSGEIVKGMAFVSGQTYTMSFYAKTESGTLDFIYGNMDYFTISGTATDEWQRFVITQTLPTTTRFPKIQTTEIGSLLLWGWQVEQGSYATSYIPTSGSTVTRVQDQYSKTGISDKINSEQGVLFVEMAATSLSSNYDVISLSDGTTSNVVGIFYLTNTKSININVKKSGVSVFSGFASTITYPPLDFHKIALKYKTGDFALWIDGTEVLTGIGAFTNLGLSNLQLADGNGTSNNFFGKVKQLQVFKTALTDSELATLTTI